MKSVHTHFIALKNVHAGGRIRTPLEEAEKNREEETNMLEQIAFIK